MESRDSETTDPTRKLRPPTRKLPLPIDSETNGIDSETTQQRLGNLKHVRRDSGTITAQRLGNQPVATWKLPCPRLGNYIGSTRKLWGRLGSYGRDSETAATTRKLTPDQETTALDFKQFCHS